MGAVARELQPPPPPGTPGLFSLADGSALEQSVREAGFTDVHSEPLNITFKFDSMDEYIRYLKDVAAPINNLIADQGGAQRGGVVGGGRSEPPFRGPRRHPARRPRVCR